MWHSIKQIVNSNGLKRLHKRVEQSMLKYSTLERRGLGVAKVSTVSNSSVDNIFIKGV